MDHNREPDPSGPTANPVGAPKSSIGVRKFVEKPIPYVSLHLEQSKSSKITLELLGIRKEIPEKRKDFRHKASVFSG
jgi:hypothetical protein